MDGIRYILHSSNFAVFAISNVVGVPLRTLIGQLGIWQLTFWFTTILVVISLVMSIFVLPKKMKAQKASAKEQLGLLKDPRMVLAFFIPIFPIVLAGKIASGLASAS